MKWLQSIFTVQISELFPKTCPRSPRQSGRRGQALGPRWAAPASKSIPAAVKLEARHGLNGWHSQGGGEVSICISTKHSHKDLILDPGEPTPRGLSTPKNCCPPHPHLCSYSFSQPKMSICLLLNPIPILERPGSSRPPPQGP